MITHNTYFEGSTQSLGYNRKGEDFSVGVVLPGEYDFGVAERQETITVVHGVLTVNGRELGEGWTQVIHPGEQIKVSCKMTATYACKYD